MLRFCASRRTRNLIRLVLILVGVALTTAAAVGTRTYLAPAEAASAQYGAESAQAAIAFEAISDGLAQYRALDQQSAIIKLLYFETPDLIARQQIARLHRLAMLERAGSTRLMIEQVFLAKEEKTFLKEQADYEALTTRCLRDGFCIGIEATLGHLDHGFKMRALNVRYEAQLRRKALLQSIVDLERVVDSRKLLLLVIQTIGSTFLVLAFLF